MSTIIERCRHLASFSEDPAVLTRTFLSTPMHDVHRELRSWMEKSGMLVSVDGAGNLRGFYEGTDPHAPRLLVGSHVDTVPSAGIYDGQLGVVFGIALIEELKGRRMRFPIEVIAFSEEEGVRFSLPFIGSRAVVEGLDDAVLGTMDGNGTTVSDAIRQFGLDPHAPTLIRENVLGFFELHIEQGPLLESLGLGLGVVEAIVGQSRAKLMFRGHANHAGTTPMHLRRDALAACAEWISAVERIARECEGLVATVGRIEARPGAGNVIVGEVEASLDVRHPQDQARLGALKIILQEAAQAGDSRGVRVDSNILMDQSAMACDQELTNALERAVSRAGQKPHLMVSGAGHDAMIMARRFPVAMLFVQSPGGLSHHPDESVRAQDLDRALRAGMLLLDELEALIV